MAKKKVFLNGEQRKEVLSLIKEKKWSYGEIADSYNVTPGVISRIARQNGIFIRQRRKKSKPSQKLVLTPKDLLSTESLLNQMEEAYSICEEKVKEWTKAKTNACKKLDQYRKKQSELYVAIQAIKRSNEANHVKENKS